MNSLIARARAMLARFAFQAAIFLAVVQIFLPAFLDHVLDIVIVGLVWFSGRTGTGK